MTTQTEAAREPQHQNLSEVAAAALGCVLAGVGAGAVIGIVIAGAGYGVTIVLTWAIATWCFVAGALLFWRFGGWAVVAVAQIETLKMECDRLDDENQLMADTIEALKLERDAYMREAETLALLRNKTPNFVPSESELDPVRQTARTMADYWLSTGQHPSRRRMEEQGVSQGQYAQALEYLKQSGALEQTGSQVAWKVNSREQFDLVFG